MNIPGICLAFLIVGSAAASAQEYEVKFNHAHKPGDKRSAVVKMEKTSEQWIVVNGKRLSDRDRKSVLNLEMTAEIEDTAVDAEGIPSAANVVLKTCHFEKDGKEADILKAGDKIRSVRGKDGKAVVTVNDQPASPEAASLLTFALTTQNSGGKGYGPHRKVKVGESWPMDSEFGVEDLNKQGVPAPKGSVKGGMKLLSAHPVHGLPCLQLSGYTDVDMSGVAIPTGPPGTKAKKFEMHLKVAADLPVDPTAPKLNETTESTMESEGVGTVDKDGQTISFSFFIEGHQKQEIAYTPH